MEKFGSGINIPDLQQTPSLTQRAPHETDMAASRIDRMESCNSLNIILTPAFYYRTCKTDVDPALKPHIQAELEELEEQDENLGILQFLDRLEQVTETFLNR